MGWKAKVREIANRNPAAVPADLLADTFKHHSRRWPVIQKNATRNAMIGIALVGTVFFAMHVLAIGYELNTTRLHTALAVASFVFASLFCLLGESVVEDGVKSVIIAITGCLFALWFPLPWCLIPGAGAVVDSIVNGTDQGMLGRYF